MQNMLQNIKEGKQTASYSQRYGNMFEVSYTPIRTGVFNIYLYGVIESAEQFIPAIEVLQAATENDVVVIHLSSPGGDLYATDTFLDSMRNCDARIIVRATGGVMSAGTLILLAADEFTLSENCSFMLHNGSTGSAGKFSDWKAEVKHTEAYMERIMRKTYEGFLSCQELDDLLKGVDIWLDSDQFVQRYEARNEYLRGKMQDAQEDFLESILAQQQVETVVKEKPPRKKKKKDPVLEEI